MRKLSTLLFLFFYIGLNSQVLYPIYNPIDSTFTFSFPQSLDIAKTKKEKRNLEKEVKVLSNLGGQHERIIEKLNYKDSLSQIEIEACDRANQMLSHKIDNSVVIINNYRLKSEALELQLEEEKKETKKQKYWKNFYMVTAPVVIIIFAFLK